MKFVKYIPNALTLGNLSLGVCGVAVAFLGYIGWGAVLMFLAMFFDLWDGKLARILGVHSKIGADLDSLADAVSFGMAPALLFYVSLSFQIHTGDSSIAWLTFADIGSEGQTINIALLALAAFYASCAALRLAIFNSMEDHTKFQGIPSTMACGLALTTAGFNFAWQGLAGDVFGWVPANYPGWLTLITFILLPILMVSKVPYPKAGAWFFGSAKTALGWTTNILMIVGIICFFRYGVHIFFIGYVLGGPVFSMIKARRLAGAQ